MTDVLGNCVKRDIAERSYTISLIARHGIAIVKGWGERTREPVMGIAEPWSAKRERGDRTPEHYMVVRSDEGAS